MEINIIKSPIAKAILAAVGSAAAFLELSLTPHTAPWIIVGAIIAALTPVAVYAQGNSDPDLAETTVGTTTS